MKKFIIILLTVFLPSVVVLAQQTGQISGIIVDAENGDTIIGASIGILGTTTGTSSDIDGNYNITDLEPGTYDLRVSYISYQTQNIIGVDVVAGKITKLDIAMQTEVANLDEITVTAKAVLDNEAGLLRQRQKSIAFSDAISAEAISQSGSGDAAAAMKKVVGASVVDGKYIYVRGLGDRYSSTHLNGAELPSADPNRKSFQLDIFPSNLLENIVTLKTFTPNKPGNFSGGLVDISTKDFPNQLSFQISASNSWNSQTSLDNTLLTSASSTDWLGYDDGGRDLPKEVENYFNNGATQFPSGTSASRDPGLADTLNNLSNAFNPDFTPESKTPFLNQSYSISIGNRASLFDRELGYVASLSYGQSYSQYANGFNGRYAQIGSSSQTDALSPIFEYSDEKGSRNIDLGGLVNFAYKITDDNKIGVTYMRTQSGSTSGRILNGTNEDATGTLSNSVLEYIERSLSSFQLDGKHYLPNLLKTTFEWKSTLATNTQSEPQRRQIALLAEDRVLGGQDTTLYSFPNGFALPSAFYRDLEESNVNLSADLTVPFVSFNNMGGNFKIGLSSIETEREFRENIFDFVLGSPNSVSLNELKGDLDAYFGMTGIIGQDNLGRPIFGVVPRRISDTRNNFDGDKSVFSYYAMIELPISSSLKVIGGVRVEDAEINIASLDTSVTKGRLSNRDLLPSLNSIYSLNDRMNLRASFTKTLARPTFRELAPYASAEFTNGGIERGNQNLKRTLITNYDLRWEWFPSAGDVIAVSGFYKEFDNPIESVIEIEFGDGDFTYQNVPEASVLGIEFEARKNLAFITEALRYFTISTNLTLVDSDVKIPEEELIVIRNTEPNASDERQLQGQSPFILNFDVSYSNPEIEFNSSLNFNSFGDRLSKVSAGASPDIFERSYNTLDFLMSKSISKNFELSFSAKNLLDPVIMRSQEFKNQEFVNSSYKRGRSFSLGVKYKIQ